MMDGHMPVILVPCTVKILWGKDNYFSVNTETIAPSINWLREAWFILILHFSSMPVLKCFFPWSFQTKTLKNFSLPVACYVSHPSPRCADRLLRLRLFGRNEDKAMGNQSTGRYSAQLQANEFKAVPNAATPRHPRSRHQAPVAGKPEVSRRLTSAPQWGPLADTRRYASRQQEAMLLQDFKYSERSNVIVRLAS
jgi:hypothetical protein